MRNGAVAVSPELRSRSASPVRKAAYRRSPDTDTAAVTLNGFEWLSKLAATPLLSMSTQSAPAQSSSLPSTTGAFSRNATVNTPFPRSFCRNSSRRRR